MRIDVGKCHLQRILDANNMSQSELARRLGVHRQHIQHYVSGKRTMSFKSAYAISMILNCNMEDLYDITLTPGNTSGEE